MLNERRIRLESQLQGLLDEYNATNRLQNARLASIESLVKTIRKLDDQYERKDIEDIC